MKYLSHLHAGHLLDDGRMDHHQTGQNHMTIYGPAGVLRSNSSNSSSPGGGNAVHNSHGNPAIGSSTIGGLSHHGHVNTPAALLVVPQPINATKIGSSLNGPGTGRKYQCKMCPQVNYYFIHTFSFAKIDRIRCKKKKSPIRRITNSKFKPWNPKSKWRKCAEYRRKKNENRIALSSQS